ncbi:CHAD domain-containing protein [Streptomyces stelliscabiei]|uniref:CHAD domain-containing protein n=1 Tax=Streptomyces stelliscabiei TaxID=146820 RepID=UPI0029B37C6A|nr:CHAD domain-containing protein [Streptomyces stelliscabiei]MDX3628113.1 CHAD domain-containing protein [Streptomyces stelliscabiei]
MAQQHLDPTTDPTVVPADAVASYLRARATEFLRALRTHRETGGGAAGGAEESTDAALALRRSARRISGTLHTFRPLLDTDWSESLRPELAWLAGTLGREHAYAARLDRLVTALNRLSGASPFPAQPALPTRATAAASASGLATATTPGGRSAGGRSTAAASTAGGRSTAVSAVGSRAAGAERAGTGGTSQAFKAPGEEPGTAGPGPRPAAAPDRGSLTVGAAKAGALLDRQLTLARTRAHSAALQALGSSRFHAVADNVAVLASEVPLTPAAPIADLRPLAAAAHDRLRDAVTGLPLHTAGHAYNAEALIHGLSADTAPHPQDAPWHQVRLLLRLHRYALEVLHPEAVPVDVRLLAAGEALNRHRDASEAASAAAAAARTPRIAPATAYALGVLHADQRHEVEASRFTFQQSWQKEAVNTS